MPHKNTINKICKPLFAQTEITYFSHTRVDNHLKFSGLSSDNGFAEHYLKEKFYNFDIHLLNLYNKIRYIHWDMINYTDEILLLQNSFNNFGYGHTFTVIETHDDYTDCFHFAADVENYSINNKYYSYLKLLDRYILFFKEQLIKDKKISLLYKTVNNIENHSDHDKLQKSIYPSSNYFSKSDFLVIDAENKIKLSKREVECMHWMSQGKTMEEISLILNIGRRTVRTHIENCKIKLNCTNLFQLGKASHSLDLGYILEQ